MKSFFVCCVVLLAVVSAIAAQESQFPPYFEGRWTATKLAQGTLNLCVEGNKVFGGFNIGYLTAQLSPDRRTMVGKLYVADNSGVFDEAEFKVSMTGDNLGFVGEIDINDEVSVWTESKVSSSAPLLHQDCFAPDTTFGATIEGQWTTGGGQVLNLCVDEDGLDWYASFGDQYHRGPVLPFAKGARGSWWSGSQNGGSIFRLVGENTMLMSTHTNDVQEVQQYGCNSAGGAQCVTAEVFQRVGATSPNQCSANSQLAVWNGWYTHTPTQGRMALRRAGSHVHGSFRYGVLEGQVDEADPMRLSGVWYTAGWSDQGLSKAKYFGTFSIKLGADLQTFSGDLELGADGSCGRSQCSFEWTERRMVGPNREPNADETFAITQLPVASAQGSDGAWVPTYNENVRFYFCLQWKDDDDDSDDDDDETGTDLDNSGRQQWLGSYTDFGCGRVTGGVRGAKELGSFESDEPAQTTSNGIWYDDAGFGNQIQRRINANYLREEWFLGATPSNPPATSFCDPITEIKCGQITYAYEQRNATHSECLHCFIAPSAASALATSAFFLVVAFLAVIF